MRIIFRPAFTDVLCTTHLWARQVTILVNDIESRLYINYLQLPLQEESCRLLQLHSEHEVSMLCHMPSYSCHHIPLLAVRRTQYCRRYGTSCHNCGCILPTKALITTSSVFLHFAYNLIIFYLLHLFNLVNAPLTSCSYSLKSLSCSFSSTLRRVHNWPDWPNNRCYRPWSHNSPCLSQAYISTSIKTERWCLTVFPIISYLPAETVARTVNITNTYRPAGVYSSSTLLYSATWSCRALAGDSSCKGITGKGNAGTGLIALHWSSLEGLYGCLVG